jgi:hypothetical protein
MLGKVLRRSAVILLAYALALGITAPSAAAATPVQAQSGAWVTNFPCTLVDYDMSSNEFVCVGSNDWTGTLTGITYFTMVGRLNPVTLEAEGRIEERFVGAGGAKYGTLRLLESFTAREGRIRAVTESVEGTGMLKGFAEKMTFNGAWTLVSGGGGTYNA